MQKERVIWSSHCDFSDWEEDLRSDHPEMSESELYEEMCFLNDEYLNDERYNLDITLENPIIVIGDLGLWYGRRQGYKELNSRNIKDCLVQEEDYNTWYVDDAGDLRCEASHHDGTNYYTYREWKPGISENQKDTFKEKLYNGTATRQDVVKYTRRLGDAICRVYGWNIAGRPVKRKSGRTN